MRIFLGLIAAAALTLPAHAGLVGFYQFENSFNDGSGNGNNGVNHGATFAAGYQGQAANIVAGDNYITVPIDINPTAMQQVTFGAWVKVDPNYTTGRRGIISHDDGGYDRTLDIDDRDATGYSAFTGSYVLGSGSVPLGWTFIAARYDAVAHTVVLNVDGNKYTRAANPGPGPTSLTFGRNPGFPERFVGLIDNAFVYNTVLSDDKIDIIRRDGASAILADATATPEPSTFALMGLGLLAAGAIRRAKATR